MIRVEYQRAGSAIKHPAKVAIAIAQDKNGKFNPITLEWFMKTSIFPPMYAISIGHTRYSYECLLQSRFFNLCFPSYEMVEAVKMWGTESGREKDKLAAAGHEWFEGRLAKFPIIKAARVVFECQIVSQVKSGDHTIFVGEVKYSWLNDGKELITVKDLL
jgi:flavin reductase (DIM6/NTAB) family NADH-FMN oxidoreductase RutF